MERSAPSKDDWETIRRFERTMGKGLATAENMKAAAPRYETESKVLRDERTYKAALVPAGKWPNRQELNDDIMAVTKDRPYDLAVNRGHAEFGNNEFLRAALRHEPFHGKHLALVHQQGSTGAAAAVGGDLREAEAYRELTRKADGRALLNPDHLAEFARR
jgi:hypothetical protein